MINISIDTLQNNYGCKSGALVINISRGKTMKTWHFALLAAFLFPVISIAAGHGPGDGGGGDEVGLDFEASLHSAVEIIQVSGRTEFAPLSRLDWTKMEKNLKVLAVDKKLYATVDGVKQESVALNYPAAQMVEINRKRWKALHDPRIKEGISLHEALSVAGLESSGEYPYSGLYLSIFNYAPGPILGGGSTEGPAKPVPLPKEIAKIFPYQCNRTFLQGEGVNFGNITCVPGQHLGLISADYTFYLFESPSRNNFGSLKQRIPFESPLCGLDHLTEYSCETPSEAAYGLSTQPDSDFVVGVTLTSAPIGSGEPLTELYGYAALPDSQGRCPANLVKARPWVARPSSVVDPYPSSFVNQGNSLNNSVVSVSQPGAFMVSVIPGTQPCSTTGDCSNWSAGGRSELQTVDYFPEGPVVCVIPKEDL
jgi:hypothetical protein